MSGITERLSEPLLYTERGLEPPASMKSTLFPEDRTTNPFCQKATYYHPDFSTDIRYEAIGSSGIAYSPDPRFATPCYNRRDEALYQESLTRLKSRAHLPVSERYQGYEDGLIAKIKGIVKRVFYIITRLGVERGLNAYDLHLASQERTLAFANYSAKPAANFTVTMLPYAPLLERLGIKDFLTEQQKLQFTSTWHRNGLPAYQFKEDGKVVTLHHTVASSNDRTNDRIGMMRHVDSSYSGTSTFYTGRPDSEAKAKEQVAFIFRNEVSKPPSAQKGIVYNETTGEYELTYVVNNLMSSHGVGSTGVTWASGLDERASILKEMEVLANLGTIIVDGKKVKVKPLYFNQCFNFLNNFAKSSLQEEINQRGYKSLLELARQAPQTPLLTSAIHHLESSEELLPEEEFFYRDLICKILGLPEVIHCKSSTDRTIIAGAISMATEQWINCDKPIPVERPHEILSDPIYKELFISNAMSGHQVTRYSRSAEGIVKGARQFSQLIGLDWGKNGMGKNPIALRLVPDRYKKEGKRPLNIRITLAVLKFFNPKGATKKIAFLERAYKEEEFDHGSYAIKELKLVKPPNMKMHYPKGSVNPRDAVKKSTMMQSVKGVAVGAFKSVGLVALRAFDAIVAT